MSLTINRPNGFSADGDHPVGSLVLVKSQAKSYPSEASLIEQTQLAGAGDSLEAIRCLQLREKVVQVRLDGAHGDDQLPRDLSIRATPRQQEQHLALARAQRLYQWLAQRLT